MKPFAQINPARLTGKKYWRSLDEAAAAPEFQEWVTREFPDGYATVDSTNRRTLLKLMGASFGLAGLTSCRRPVEHILPLARASEGYIHGKPLHYASVATRNGTATGVIVTTIDGRPIKIEGNPKHPYSLGATDAFLQASALSLYDPERAREVQHRGARSDWEEFSAWAKGEFDVSKQGDGSGLRIVSEKNASPALESVRADLVKKFPKAQWIEYESVDLDAVREGAALATGQSVEPHFLFDKADIVFSLDCDFLGLDSASILPVKQFSKRRRVEQPGDRMNRLYVAEANYSLTGAMADHRLRVKVGDTGALALALAKELNVSGSELKVVGNPADKAQKFIAELAKDLAAHKGASLVVAGPRQPAAVHALAFAIDAALGNLGQTIVFTKLPSAPASSLEQLKQLVADLNAGRVKTLVVLGGNPVYTLPADLDFAAAVKQASATVALTEDENETWVASEWRLPQAHLLECWGDARALDGTVSIQQPMIEPLYGGKSVLEVAAMLAGREPARSYDLVSAYWTAQWPAAEREKKWKASLFDGSVADTRAATVNAAVDARKLMAAAAARILPASAGLEVAFYPSHGVYDGRFANNAWLHEAPDPITKVVWDNVALLSKQTAGSLGLHDGDMVELSDLQRSVEVPVMIQPGHADGSISLFLGYGRAACGRVGQGVGHRVEALRTMEHFFFAPAVDLKKTAETYQIVTSQEHGRMEGRPIVREATSEEYLKQPGAIKEMAESPQGATMFPFYDYSKGYQWGMSIDLNACIGCNACLVACQSENNIAVVGKDQVRRGRVMHWIRLDRYYSGSDEDPQIVTQPMACQQCENAPCETVCPVAATSHSPEGLNDMVYNRCVGTRYCLNNCPYKVRRFNFLAWNKDVPEVRKLVFNPDVTVRMRGVMEKCTYCVQRIEHGKIAANADGRRQLRDGEVISACQQVCPADAIVFGNINDPQSRVSKLKQQARDYALLGELNVRPRTTYLARLRNPNPALEPAAEKENS
ncbi:MAG: TAT-variant-translocated molybdopterin oxidoreductase [Bryobacteraceae bacterium]